MICLILCNELDNLQLPDAVFRAAGCQVVRVDTLGEALDKLPAVMPRLVFTSLVAHGESTLPLVTRTLARLPGAAVVVMAENDQINAAAEAMHQGAYDCLFKPFSEARLGSTIDGALRSAAKRGGEQPTMVRRLTPAVEMRAASTADSTDAEVARHTRAQGTGKDAPAPGKRDVPLAFPAHAPQTFHGMIGQSAVMRALFRRVDAVAPSRAAVLITGEVGTGKSTLAKVVHTASNRADKDMVVLDCALLGPESFDLELFGRDDTKGALARAAGGTLVLERIEELPSAQQARLVPLVQTSEISSIGQSHGLSGTLRIIATMNDTPDGAARRALRDDLYYSLKVAHLEMPPLRDRLGDVPLIAQQQLANYLASEGRAEAVFSSEALERLDMFDWPGNVRELLNMIWGIALVNDSRIIGAGDLTLPKRSYRPAAEVNRAGADTTELASLVGQRLADIERIVIEATIAEQGGSVPRAARVLDVSPSTLYRKREAWMKDGDED